MKLELVQFLNTDSVVLPGLLYEPEKGSDEILIALHGNGSSGGFYSVELQNTFGIKLTGNGISYLTFTNTGGHLIQKFDRVIGEEKERLTIGAAYELIKDCISDIDGAINFAKSRGYKHIYLIGGSTGANKICVYNYYKEGNEIEKYILQSGGDDSGGYYSAVGDKKFRLTIQECSKKNEEGKARDFVPKYLHELPISYQSLYDQINPDGDYNIFPFYWQLNGIKIMEKDPWREIKSILKPTLVVYGDKDEFCYGKLQDCVELFKRAVAGKENFFFEIIQDTDHAYFGKRNELVEIVLEFLKKS
jgi:pimeloyl-ACP methyl ester carboxylesterase